MIPVVFVKEKLSRACVIPNLPICVTNIPDRQTWPLSENIAKISDFIFAKFRDIQDNFVQISCFMKF